MKLIIVPLNNFEGLMLQNTTFDVDIIFVDSNDLEALDYGRRIGPVSALLLADQGYGPSNPPEWIAALRPQALLLSVAGGDRNRMPHLETLEAGQGYTLLRTDQSGWIERTSDGEQMWVEVERR